MWYPPCHLMVVVMIVVVMIVMIVCCYDCLLLCFVPAHHLKFAS